MNLLKRVTGYTKNTRKIDFRRPISSTPLTTQMHLRPLGSDNPVTIPPLSPPHPLASHHTFPTMTLRLFLLLLLLGSLRAPAADAAASRESLDFVAAFEDRMDAIITSLPQPGAFHGLRLKLWLDHTGRVTRLDLPDQSKTSPAALKELTARLRGATLPAPLKDLPMPITYQVRIKTPQEAYAISAMDKVRTLLATDSLVEGYEVRLHLDKKGLIKKAEVLDLQKKPSPELAARLKNVSFGPTPDRRPATLTFTTLTLTLHQIKPADAIIQTYRAAVEARVSDVFRQILPKMPAALAQVKMTLDPTGRPIEVDLLDQYGTPLPFRHLSIALLRTKFDPPPPDLPMPLILSGG